MLASQGKSPCLSRLGAHASEIQRVFQEVQDARSAVRQLLAMLKT